MGDGEMRRGWGPGRMSGRMGWAMTGWDGMGWDGVGWGVAGRGGVEYLNMAGLGWAGLECRCECVGIG